MDVKNKDGEYMYKAIIFDFDYTLGNSEKGIALSINYALKQMEYEEKPLFEIKKTIGLSLKETFYKLTLNEDPERAGRFAVLFKEKADLVMVDQTELYPGVKTVLQKLKQKGYRTAIVTTKYHYRIEQILNKFDAIDLINVIVGAEDVKIEKPDPEGLLWTIKNMGFSKEEILYVGDSLVDAKTAENAGVDFVGVLTGTTTKMEFEDHRNVYIGNNIEDVYAYVKSVE